MIEVGDCREVMRAMGAESVDAIVTDPPYELGFMGKKWDASGVAYDVEVWRQCLRVLKPGGHLLAFGAPRTYHRMACAIEDAGFEIRDSLHWIYGTGFPKSKQHLKPAHEPIVMARSSFKGSCLELQIERSRIGQAKRVPGSISRTPNKIFGVGLGGSKQHLGQSGHRSDVGRWPSNVIGDVDDRPWFYKPKASRKEREGNPHPTVKPVDLMRWLVRLVTPPGGLVLDPFTGSGTTGVACLLEGMAFRGVELSEDYAAIARQRLEAHDPGRRGPDLYP